METVHIYRLDHLSPSLAKRIYEGQMEAARVWTLCRDLHLHARRNRLPWPKRKELQQATKGKFALHSQTVQMIFYAFLGNVDACRKVKQQNPKMRYPYKDKKFSPLMWERSIKQQSRRTQVMLWLFLGEGFVHSNVAKTRC